MKILSKIAPVLALLLSVPGMAYACEDYSSFELEEIKEFRDMLDNTDADPLDRLFAFEQMVCSDRPNIRSYAIKQGLNTIQDPLVRNEVMFKAMMQKTRIDVELSKGRELSDEDKKFIQDNAGVYSHIVTYRSQEDGCISLHRDRCATEYSVFIVGDKVELNYSRVSGEFRLSGSGELVGTLRASDRGEYTRIPAVIKLF